MGWETPQAARISEEDAQELLMALIQALRAESITEPSLETLLKRCEKYLSELFTYLAHEGMPPDNNKAERGLRKYAVQRKISGDFKNPELMKHYAVYLSLFMTCALNGKDFDDLLAQLFGGTPFDLSSFLFGTA